MASEEIDVEEAKSHAPAKVHNSSMKVVRELCPKSRVLPSACHVQVGFADIAKHFVLMGWTAFGGYP